MVRRAAPQEGLMENPDSPLQFEVRLAVTASEELAGQLNAFSDAGYARRALDGNAILATLPLFTASARDIDRMINEYERGLKASPDLTQKPFRLQRQLETRKITDGSRLAAIALELAVSLNSTEQERVLTAPFFSDGIRRKSLHVSRVVPLLPEADREGIEELIGQLKERIDDTDHPSTRGNDLTYFGFSVSSLRVVCSQARA